MYEFMRPTSNVSFNILPALLNIIQTNVQGNKVELTSDMLNQFKVKAKNIAAFTMIWSSQGTQSKDQVSLWEPSIQSSMLSNNRVSLLML